MNMLSVRHVGQRHRFLREQQVANLCLLSCITVWSSAPLKGKCHATINTIVVATLRASVIIVMHMHVKHCELRDLTHTHTHTHRNLVDDGVFPKSYSQTSPSTLSGFKPLDAKLFHCVLDPFHSRHFDLTKQEKHMNKVTTPALWLCRLTHSHGSQEHLIELSYQRLLVTPVVFLLLLPACVLLLSQVILIS